MPRAVRAEPGLPSRRLTRWAWAVPLGALIAALTLVVLSPVPLRTARNAVFDQFQRWYPRPYLAPAVRIVDIDEESLRRVGQWPWSRTQVAQLLAGIRAQQPASVSLDIMFAEPERRAVVEGASAAGGTTGAYPTGPAMALSDPDRALAEEIRRGRVVLGFALTGSGSRSEAPGALLTRSGFVAIGGDPVAALPGFTGSITNLPDLQTAASGQGAMTFMPDVDGLVRHVPLLFNLQGQPVPSLTAEALRVGEGASGYVARTSPGEGGLIDVRIGARVLDVDQSGALWVHYARAQPQRYIPAWRVMEGHLDATALRGQLVLIGTSAQGLLDLRFSPLGGIIPGVEVHAQAIEQIVSGQQLARPGWAPAAEWLLALVGGLLVGIVALRARPGRSSATLLVLGVGVGVAAWSGFRYERLLIDPSGPWLAMLAVFTPTTLMRYRWAERRQRWMQSTFSRYVSPNLIDYLLAHPQALELGGRRQRCSFVFTDLAGFTARMESMDPAVAVTVLNTYLDRMIAIAFQHDGTLDRIVGDAVAIMFSAPVPQADHEARALRCALDMQAFARSYVDELKRQGIEFCETRIGVHTGEVTVGNFGGDTMFDYRALGDPVNTAARLEGANKYLGTSLCVSEETLKGCPEAVTREIGQVKLSGRSAALRLYEAIGLKDRGSAEDLDYQWAFDQLRAGSDEALAAFEALALSRPRDGLVCMHRDRLRAGHRHDWIELATK
ncbi:hypothetical protein CDN98_11535 [Roseateles terrae]|nr:hypothetical protein CDN98_11535 [Roseateles terrae]